MAVPKKRTGSSAQGHRRSNWKATKPEVTKCATCGEVVLTHTVCTACGHYKGKVVSIKSPDYVETKPEVKKAPKKATSKTEKTTKTKKAEAVETEAVVEESKTEVVEDIKTEESTEKAED